jgi:hypothetical protein
MFLLRSAFWLTLVVLLIPADPETGDAPRVTVAHAVDAMRATVADLSGFCGRNPDVCATGSAAFHIVAEKTGDGVDLILRTIRGDDAAPAPDNGIDMAPGAPDATRGTLTTDDLMLPWQAAPGDDPA